MFFPPFCESTKVVAVLVLTETTELRSLFSADIADDANFSIFAFLADIVKVFSALTGVICGLIIF